MCGNRQGSLGADNESARERSSILQQQLYAWSRVSRGFVEKARKVSASSIKSVWRRGATRKHCWFVYTYPLELRKLTLITDYMKATAKDGKVDIAVFWDILQRLLIPVWPQNRTVVNGQAIGDAWPLSTLKHQKTSEKSPSSNIQPFHKLTQWLAYSLMVPFQRILGLEWTGTDSLTALPEYRNGGLFVDMGVLSLKQQSLDKGLKASGRDLPMFKAGDDVVVEWRAMTLVLVDKLYKIVLDRMDGVHLSMAQLLEAGTWKSGREVAAKNRPETKSSPIIIESDGTVF
jgi:hypothetical protein